MVKSPFSNGASPLRRRLHTTVAFLGLAWLAAAKLAAGPAFDQAEYAARRQKLMAAIPDGVAVIFGAPTLPGYTSFFQGNDFMYLCGVEVPNAILVVFPQSAGDILCQFSEYRQSAADLLTVSASQINVHGAMHPFCARIVPKIFAASSTR